MNEKPKKYLIEAYKFYLTKSFDAIVVMLARVTEYALKKYLIRKRARIPKKPVLSSLTKELEKREPKK